MPDWLATILLGVIEGVTEFLPVSSTGHLQLAERWLTPKSELFDILVQCGAVLAVILVFQKRIQSLAGDLKSPTSRDYLLKLGVAFALTIIGVLAAEKLNLKVRKEDVAAAVWAARVAWATLIGGVFFVAIEYWLRGRQTATEISWLVVAFVALGQILAATYSGTSRSGATILFALALGVSRPAATEFSFLLGIPTLLAAGGYKVLKAWKNQQLGTENWPLTLLALAVAAVTAFVVVKWLLRYVQTHTFTPFGWYRIGLGILILMLIR